MNHLFENFFCLRKHLIKHDFLQFDTDLQVFTVYESKSSLMASFTGRQLKALSQVPPVNLKWVFKDCFGETFAGVCII